jgi:hypothetical protein
MTHWRDRLPICYSGRRVVQAVEKRPRARLLVSAALTATGWIGSRLGPGDQYRELTASLHGSRERARRLSHGAWRRPQPDAARKHVRFSLAAINSPSMFAFHKRRNRSRRQRAIRAISPETA